MLFVVYFFAFKWPSVCLTFSRRRCCCGAWWRPSWSWWSARLGMWGHTAGTALAREQSQTVINKLWIRNLRFYLLICVLKIWTWTCFEVDQKKTDKNFFCKNIVFVDVSFQMIWNEHGIMKRYHFLCPTYFPRKIFFKNGTFFSLFQNIYLGWMTRVFIYQILNYYNF